MTQQEIPLIETKSKKPENFKIKLIKMYDAFYKISINQKQFDSLNENEKIPIYIYLNELQEKLNDRNMYNIIVKEDNDD